MMPAGHGEGGDASQCPFAMMMKAMEANPGLRDKLKKEADEVDSDTDEEDEEYYRAGAEAYDKARTAREAEAEERRQRMMAAMKESHTMKDGGSATTSGRPMPQFSSEDMAYMQAMAAGKVSDGGTHGQGGDPSSCPFAMMFGMPAQEKKPKPPSILQKWIKKTEAEIAEQGEDEDEGEGGGGCPFAAAFGVSSEPSELEKRQQELLERADKPGQGQYIWKRKNVVVEEAEEEVVKAPVKQPEPKPANRKPAAPATAKKPAPKQVGKSTEPPAKFNEEGVPTTQEGLNDALQQAAQMKSAKLKADPRRREWEMAPTWMRCTCSEEGDLGTIRQEDFQARIAKATAWREQANELFREGSYEAAISVYANSLGIFLWFKRGEGRSTENVKLINETEHLPDDESAQAVDTIVKGYVNIAACLVKMENWKECEYACNKALSFDQDCVKALYRRAQVFKAENSAYMLELAVKDLKQALKVQPDNTDVKRFYKACIDELKKQNHKDSATFGNMFSRGGGLYSPEEAEAMRKHKPQEEREALNPDSMNPEAIALAKAMGIDLSDPKVRSELHRLDKMSKEGKKGAAGDGATKAERKQHWWIEMTLKYKWVAYLLLALHMTWAIAMTWFQMRAQAQQRKLGMGPPSLGSSMMANVTKVADTFSALPPEPTISPFDEL